MGSVVSGSISLAVVFVSVCSELDSCDIANLWPIATSDDVAVLGTHILN